MRRVFYFAPVSTDALNQHYGRKLYSGPLTGKVFGVCAAIRAAGAVPVVVSALIPSSLRGLSRCVVLHRTSGTSFAKVASIGGGLTKRLSGSFGFLAFAVRFVRPGDRVLLYNFFPDYILAALYLKVIGRPSILDIEDAPRADEPGLRGFGNRLSFAILSRLCRDRYVTAGRVLGDSMGLRTFLPVSGVFNLAAAAHRREPIFSGARVKVLYGGAIMRETGLDLFVAALRHLAASDPDLPIHVTVTGRFPVEQLRAVAAEIEAASRIRMDVHSDLTASEYRDLAGTQDIGLSLKLPDDSMGGTTFPSKVIEYASIGLLVVSTPVSDVPYIFTHETAVILESSEPEDLARRLAAAVRDRAGSAEQARRGTLAISAGFSREAVGRRLVDFLYG